MAYKPSQFNTWYQNGETAFLYNTFTTGLLKLNGEQIGRTRSVLDEPRKLEEMTADEKNILSENGFLLDEDIDEIEMLKYRYYRGAFNNRWLTFTIIPTTDCNFACPYCFELEKSHRRLSEGDVAEIIAFLTRELSDIRPESFGFSWYGGEPLLCMDTVERISGEVTSLCRELSIKRGKDFMLTNGYLLDEKMAQRMVRANIDGLQISIDGDEADHNSTRKLRNGGGTFRQVMDAIIISERYFSRVDVRINTNKKNYPGVVSMLKREGVFASPKVFVSIGNLRQYMGGQMEQREDCDCFSGKEHQQIQQSIHAIINDLKGGCNGMEDQADFFVTKLNYCGADQHKNFFVGPGTAVYKCAERTDPGEEVGHIKNGELVPSKRYWEWFQNNPFKDATCRKCAYLPICMGGCPSARMRLKIPNDEICGYWEQWLVRKMEKY